MLMLCNYYVNYDCNLCLTSRKTSFFESFAIIRRFMTLYIYYNVPDNITYNKYDGKERSYVISFVVYYKLVFVNSTLETLKI